MAWFYLVIAGLLETAWAVGIKRTDGFSRLWPTVVTVLCMFSSFGFLALALREIPIGTGYAVWTGIGAVGAATAGILLFNEPKDWPRLAGLFLIMVGVFVLKLTSHS